MSTTYNYSAVNDEGRTVRGSVLADNEVDLESRLKALGLELIKCKEVKSKSSGFARKVSIKDMVILCLHLEQLSRAGVPIYESLTDARDGTENPMLRDVMSGVCDCVSSGDKLSVAMQKFPHVFDRVFIGLVETGEKNGNLTDSFVHMSDHLKWSNDLKRKVKKAVSYPIVLLVVMSGVITVLMIAVVPKLIDFMVNQGFDIPIHTRALIWVSGAFVDSWYIILGTPVILFILFITFYKKSYGFAKFVDKIALEIPVLGPTISKINLARFTHFFSVMFQSGIDVLDSLESSKSVVLNRVINESIDDVMAEVRDGSSIHEALRGSGYFPMLVVRMFKVGEDSGNMTQALENINFFYKREVDDAVEALVGMIQPIMVSVMGGLIFWVIAAVFGPLYASFSDMNV